MLVSAEQEAQLARRKLSSLHISATMRGFIIFLFCFLKKPKKNNDHHGVWGSEASFLGPTPETKVPFSVIRFADRTGPTPSEPLGALYWNATGTTGSTGPTMKLHIRAFWTGTRASGCIMQYWTD